LTGSVEACANGRSQPLCRDGELLVANGTPYAPLPRLGAKHVHTLVAGDLRLGSSAGRWNDLAAFDDASNAVVSLLATVQVGNGTFQTANTTDDLRIRVSGGKIQEWHTSPTLGGKPAYIEVRYTRNAAATATAH
jgi:hypothetical protein